MTITLKRPATCAECGAALPAGIKAAWYRNGDVYGYDCHARTPKAERPAAQPFRRQRWDNEGHYRSSLDRGGLYTANGECIARMRCGCEDYPCCGH